MATKSTETTRTCDWCRAALAKRRRHFTRFCTTKCKTDYHTAARLVMEDLVEHGTVSIEILRRYMKRRHLDPAERKRLIGAMLAEAFAEKLR